MFTPTAFGKRSDARPRVDGETQTTRLSVIIPFLNEADSIPTLYERLSEVAGTLVQAEMELVLVDDGSTDASVEVIRSLPSTGPPIRLVRLSRNFGSHAALAAGVAHAQGDLLTFLSADLQDPPELLLEMIEKSRSGYEIVWATRASRQDPWPTKVLSRVYYSLMRRYALPQMPMGGIDVCLVDRRVVDSLGSLQERNSNIFNLLMWSGFSQCFVPYHRAERKAGRSKWTMGKKLKLAIDSFVAFSFLPIRLLSGVGVLISLAGLAWASFVVARTFLYGSPVEGWASLLSAVLIFSGVQCLMLGVLGEYLWRALDAARNRPQYIVREAVELGRNAAAPAAATTSRRRRDGALRSSAEKPG